MQNFPVISSILSASAIGLFLQDKYSLSETATCKLLKTGINHSYLIADGNAKYVFRIYSLNWRTQTEIKEEIRLLNLLRDNGIPASYPIKDVADGYIQYLNAPEGDRYGVLFSFAEGDKMLNFNAELHYKVGETMARIHQVTHNQQLQRITYTPPVLLESPIERLTAFLPADSAEMQWVVSTQKYILNELSKVNAGSLRQGSVHMDIWFDNFNITKSGDVTLFDFDFCGNGWLCLDLAYYILQLHSTEKVEAEREEKSKSFITGYESITPISNEEKRLLPVLGVSMYFFYLGIQCQRFDNWSNVFLNETYLKRFINLLVKKYFDENVIKESSVNYTMANTTKIGWIGLGLMGNPMSQQLLKAGYPVTVYNRHKDKEAELKEQGAATSPTPAELIAQTDVVFIMVTDDKAIRDLFEGDNGILKAGVSDKIIVNMSTVSPAISKEMAALCQSKNLHYLDAPVSGSVKQAETAQLVIMVGGDENTFEKARPMLEKMGKLVTNVGDTGAGNAAKLAINTLLSFYTQGLAEAVILAKSNGIAPDVLLNLLDNAAIANPFTKLKGDAIVNDNFKATFSLKNIVKDLKLSRDIGLTTPLGEAALKTFEAAIPEFGDEDLIAIYKYLDKGK